MPFTADQKAKIRFYLGYQERWIFTYTALESQLADGALSAETVTIATGILTDLAAVDASLISARARLKALKVGSIELPGKGEIVTLCSEGRRLVARLASIFGVEVRVDVYASGGSGSSGGVIPLG